ncbi:MAG TPA: FtsW/RodA/SpoVE family cell cycle protein, partial [Clostridia bacterium]|nr:FtsW/RodA/SpoVE family cell cycle protein [Clostridia bacterium]
MISPRRKERQAKQKNADDERISRGVSEALKADAKGLDFPLALTAIILSLLGLIFIYSASSYSAQLEYGDAFHYVKTQAVALVLGVFFMFAISYLDLEKVKKLNLPIYIISLVLLALVFIPGFGVEIYGARRWLNLGFFTIQPSEYAKFGLIIFLSAFIAKYGV